MLLLTTQVPWERLSQQATPEEEEAAIDEGQVVDGPSLIEVSDQRVPEGEVVIDAVQLAEVGYVVIHRSEGGRPGEVIGHAGPLAGKRRWTNYRVRLDAPVVRGEMLFAMLHGDDGDGEYGFPDEDLPLTDTRGRVIAVPFEVTYSPEPEPSPQPAAPAPQPAPSPETSPSAQ